MDESLFNKYINSVKKHKDNKDEIINYIKEKTGIILKEETIVISKKEIILYISSTLKHKLFQKNIKAILLEKGLTLKN